MFRHSAAQLAGLAGALFGWRADEFWRSTPAELAAVAGALIGSAPVSMSSVELAHLMEIYPDG